MIKKADFVTIISLVRSNNMKKMNIIYLMYAMTRAVTYKELDVEDIWKYFKERAYKA